jgi:hypothetical protein
MEGTIFTLLAADDSTKGYRHRRVDPMAEGGEAIVGGTAPPSFAVDGTAGTVTVALPLDYETTPVHVFSVVRRSRFKTH